MSAMPTACRSALYERIKTAAIQAFSPLDSSDVFEQRRMIDRVKVVVAGAVARIGRRTSSNLCMAKRGAAPPTRLVAKQAH
jgi:hypothetical protein